MVGIYPEYSSLVNEIVQYVIGIKRQCVEDKYENNDKYLELKPLFVENMERLFDEFDEFEELVERVSSDDFNLEQHKDFLRDKLHPLLMTSSIVERIYNKPLGYPGDYEMINMMMSDTDLSVGVFSKLIDALHRESVSARAHKNRLNMLTHRLVVEADRVDKKQRLFSVLCIGSGPAIEVQHFIINNKMSNRCLIHFIDFNEVALEQLECKLTELSEVNRRQPILEYTYTELTDLLNDGDATRSLGGIHSYDMVYCAGLFDYISDQICQKLIDFSALYLRGDGLLSFTNIHPNVPHQHYLEHALEWTFTYRNEEKMQNLSPPDTKWQVTTDATGMNVFLDSRKIIEREAS